MKNALTGLLCLFYGPIRINNALQNRKEFFFLRRCLISNRQQNIIIIDFVFENKPKEMFDLKNWTKSETTFSPLNKMGCGMGF